MANQPSKNLEALNTERVNTVFTPQTAGELDSAVSSVNSDGGGAIVLPKAPIGSPLDVSGLTLPLSLTTDEVAIIGHGPGVSVVDTGGGDLFDATTGTVTYDDLYFCDFRITAGAGTGISANDFHGVMERVHIQGSGGGGVGFDIQAGFDSAFINCVAFGGHIYNWRFRETADGANTGVQLLGCESQNATSESVLVSTDTTGAKTSDFKVIGGRYQSNDQRAISFGGVNYPIVKLVRFEGNDTADNGGLGDIEFTTNGGGENCLGGVVAHNEFEAEGGGATATAYGVEADATVRGTNGVGVQIYGNWFRNQATRAIHAGATNEDMAIGPNQYSSVAAKWTTGTRTRVSGLGVESANAETPTAANWNAGEVVDFADTGDGSGNGIYLLDHDESTWHQLA